MSKKNEKAYYSRIGEDGIKFSVNKPYSDKVSMGCLMHNIASVASLLKNNFNEKNVNIIDIGCGSGWTSHQFALMGHDVTGVDIASDAINAAKSTFKLSNLNYREIDFDSMGKSIGEKFDVTVFIDSLHHSDSIEKTLKSAKAVLKRGGLCIVCEPGRGHSKAPDAIEAVAKYGVTESDLPPTTLIKAAKNAGFHKYKIYASPSLMHRSLYWEYENGGIKNLIKNDFIRLLSLVSFFVFKKSKEGIVVLYN